MSTTKLSERLKRFGDSKYFIPMTSMLEMIEQAEQLEARIADLEGRGVEPFNGHTPLPWDVKEETVGHGPTLRIVRYQFHDHNRSGRAFKPILESVAGFSRQRDDIAFAHHAINSYYPLTSQVLEQREAMQVCADALADPHKMSLSAAALSRLKELGITPKP